MAKDFLQYRNHYVRDWETSETVRIMSYAARGIYQALLDAQWEKGSIPAEGDLCARLLRCEPEEWAQFAPFFDECFPMMGCGSRRGNERLARDREDALQLVEKNRAAGKASAEKRRLNSNEAEGEHPFNDRSTPVEQTLNPTTTTTTLLDDSKESSTTREDDSPKIVTEEDAHSASEPFGSVARFFLATSSGRPVLHSKVARFLKPSSSVRCLIQTYGEAGAVKLMLWVLEHKPRLGVGQVWAECQSLWREAESYNWGAPGAKREPKKNPNDRRKMLNEALGLPNG